MEQLDLPIMIFQSAWRKLSHCSKCTCSPVHVNFWGCICAFTDILLFSVHPWMCFTAALCSLGRVELGQLSSQGCSSIGAVVLEVLGGLPRIRPLLSV